MARDQRKDKERMLEFLRETPIKEAACKKAGLSRATFYRWYDEDKDFAGEVKRALVRGRERVTDLAESQLIKALQNGEAWAIRYWLNNNTSRYNAYVSANMKNIADEPSDIRPVYVMPSIIGPTED